MATNYNASLVSRFSDMILLATLVTLVPYAYAAGSQLMLLATDRSRFSGRSFAFDVVVALLAFAYATWTIVGSGYKTIAWGFVLLMAGIPVYVWMKWRAALDVPHRAHGAAVVDLTQSARNERQEVLS
jgi:APA family basic amino acid/polyamine antiporter